MRVETKEIEYCKLNIIYEADRDIVEEKINEAVTQLRKAKISGFRAGKAPDYAIKLQCKNQIDSYVRNEMFQQAYDDIVFETKASFIGRPEVKKAELKGTNFSCEMDMFKKPDFDLQEYKGLDIPKPVIADPAEEVEKALEKFRLTYGEVEPYKDDDFVEIDDQVTMDFEGTINGESFGGSKQEGALYTIGSNAFPGLDDNILGMAAGEEREFQLDLGADKADFKVKIHMGMKRIPCALDDALAKQLGIDTLVELRKQLKSIADMKAENKKLVDLKSQLSIRLVEANEINMPDWLVTMEAKQIASNKRLDWDALKDVDKEALNKSAEDNVKFSLILDSIREEEAETVLSDAEVINALKQRAASQGQDPDTFIVEVQKNGSLPGLVGAMRDEYAVQWLIDQSNIIE